MLHIHLLKSKKYFSYSLTKVNKKGVNLRLSSQLMYSNLSIAAEQLNNKYLSTINSNDVTSIIHLRIPLDYNRHNKIYQLGNNHDNSSNRNLDTSCVPLTFLVESDRDKARKVILQF